MATLLGSDMFEKLSQALRGNQNALGPHKKRAGVILNNAATKAKEVGQTVATKVKVAGKAVAKRVLDGPARQSLTKFGLGTAATNLRDGAIIGGAIEGYKHLRSKGVTAAARTGLIAAKPSLAARVGSGLVSGGRASVGPLGLALTGTMIAGEAYMQKRARERSLRGRLTTAKNRIIAAGAKAKTKAAPVIKATKTKAKAATSSAKTTINKIRG